MRILLHFISSTVSGREKKWAVWVWVSEKLEPEDFLGRYNPSTARLGEGGRKGCREAGKVIGGDVLPSWLESPQGNPALAQ